MHATELPLGKAQDIFTLTTEDEDYYIFERLEARMKFDIPELESIKLTAMY